MQILDNQAWLGDWRDQLSGVGIDRGTTDRGSAPEHQSTRTNTGQWWTSLALHALQISGQLQYYSVLGEGSRVGYGDATPQGVCSRGAFWNLYAEKNVLRLAVTRRRQQWLEGFLAHAVIDPRPHRFWHEWGMIISNGLSGLMVQIEIYTWCTSRPITRCYNDVSSIAAPFDLHSDSEGGGCQNWKCVKAISCQRPV